MAGKIGVRSAYGAGGEFIVKFPVEVKKTMKESKISFMV
jgi:hypothetical protein